MNKYYVSRWGSGGSRIKVVVVIVTSSLVATSLIVICMGQPPGIGGLTRTHTHKYPYPRTHGYPLSRVPSMGVRVYPSSSSSCRRASLCRRCHDAVALAICVTAASSCHLSSVNVVHRASMCHASCVVARHASCVSVSSSSCHPSTCRASSLSCVDVSLSGCASS